MATTTLRTFVDNIEALSVTGVTTDFTQGPPTKLETAQLPAKWVDRVGGNEAPLVFGGTAGNSTLYGTLYIAVGPVAQSTQGSNFDLAVDIYDNLMTALRAVTTRCWPGGYKATFQPRVTNIAVGEVMYWAVVMDISEG